MANEAAERLFNYLRDIIFAPEKAELDIDSIPEDFQELAQGMQFLEECAKEQRILATALAKGDLSTPPPSVENVFAAPMKALQGSLIHMTWQTQQVAKGDYGQRLDFMGEFSDAFNMMVKQLKERQEALVAERDNVLQKNKQLALTQELLVTLTVNAEEWTIVLDSKTSDVLFLNKAAESFRRANPGVSAGVRQLLSNCPKNTEGKSVQWELSFVIDYPIDGGLPRTRYYAVSTHAVPWEGKNAYAHVLSDITETRENEIETERLTYKDVLTNLFSRRLGMDMMHTWINMGYSFCLSFVTINYLKRVNDEYGRNEGNRFVLRVADALQTIPDEKMICRVAGDQFLVLKRNTGTEELDKMLADINKNLLNYEAPDHLSYMSSISYGTVDVPADKEFNISALMSEADTKMINMVYALKHELLEKNTDENFVKTEF